MFRFTLIAALALTSSVASASDGSLTISYPNYRPYYTPSTGPTIAFPGKLQVTFPTRGLPAFDLTGYDGPIVAEIPNGLSIDLPGAAPVDLNHGELAVIDLGNTSGVTLEFPTNNDPILVFPYSWRPPVQLGNGSGLSVTDHGGSMTISFPGTYNPPVTLNWWEHLPRIEMPNGGAVVATLPWTSTPPIDLDPGAGLTVDIPYGQTQTFWFSAVTPTYNWYWY